MQFSADEARIANRIRAVDRELDEIERQARESVENGLKGGGTGIAALTSDRVQRAADRRHAELLEERSGLAAELKAQVEGNRT